MVLYTDDINKTETITQEKEGNTEYRYYLDMVLYTDDINKT